MGFLDIFKKMKEQKNELIPVEQQKKEKESIKNEIALIGNSVEYINENWNISISFGKSTSSNYEKAVYLAKMSPNYHEQGEGKSILHQATFTSSPDDYLYFIQLYELVGSWKSSFVFINGRLTDRKIVGGLNYCYGDKCRSGNKEFCYGASEYTENPFGCHRLQISKFNNPWWNFGILDTKNIWHIDKKTILERINQNSQPYKNCPSFSYENVIDSLEKLPNTLNPKKNKEWEIRGNKVCPKGFGCITEINVDLSDIL